MAPKVTSKKIKKGNKGQHKKGPGRPRRFSADLIADALRRNRGMVSSAARSLGCDRKTIDRACDRHPELREILDEEREVQLDRAELQLFQAIDGGHGWAVCFFLKTRGRHRGYSERIEHSEPGGQSIPVRIVIPENGR